MAPSSSDRKPAATVELREVREASLTEPGSHVQHAAPVVVWEQEVPTRATVQIWRLSLGLASLSLVLIATGAMAFVLVASDQKAQSAFAISSPSSAVAGLNAFANLMLILGVGQGVFLGLWRTRDGLFSPNYPSLPSPRRRMAYVLSYMPVLALLLKLIVVDAILVPMAISIYKDTDPLKDVQLLVPKMVEFPVSESATDTKPLSDYQNYVVGPWRNSVTSDNSQLATFFQGCNGSCATTFQGVGFAYDCVINSTDVDYGKLRKSVTPLPVFSTSFALDGTSENKDYTSINFNGLYYQAQDTTGSCAGQLLKYTCDIRPALFDIDITVYNYAAPNAVAGVALGFPSNDDLYHQSAWNMFGNQTNEWRFRSYLDFDDETSRDATRLIALQDTLQEYLGSSANISYTDTGSWELNQRGWYAADQMAQTAAAYSSDTTPMVPGTCNYNFGDPTLDIVHRINSLALFLNTLPVAQRADQNDSTWATRVTGYQTSLGDHFRTSYPAMYGLLATVMISVVVILPRYYQYWMLARSGMPEF